MAFLLWLQQFRHPLLDIFFSFWTLLGTDEFYLVAIPVIYWLVDRKLGLRLAVFFSISIQLNSLLKDHFALARPQGEGLRVLMPDTGSGYGFPSGHAQGSTTFWGYLALKVRQRRFWLIAVMLVALISFSRLYLGLHYPADILGGVAAGVVWLVNSRLLDTLDWERAAAGKLLLSLGLTVLALLLYHGEPAFKLAGSVLGSLWGYWWLGSKSQVSPAGFPSQIGRVALALGLLQLLRFGLKPLLPWPGWGDLVRYFILGLVSYGPMVKLFDTKNSSANVL